MVSCKPCLSSSSWGCCGFSRRDIDGTEVTISTISDQPEVIFPFRRALAWQAVGAIDLARERKLLPEAFDATLIDLKVPTPPWPSLPHPGPNCLPYFS